MKKTFAVFRLISLVIAALFLIASFSFIERLKVLKKFVKADAPPSSSTSSTSGSGSSGSGSDSSGSGSGDST